MKTSNLLAFFAVLSGFAIITTANLTLKSEYTKGHLKDPMVRRELPPFRCIVDQTDTSRETAGNFDITVSSKESYAVSHHPREDEQFSFEVKRDTLFITNNPDYNKEYRSWRPISIVTPKLDQLDVRNGQYTLNYTGKENLSVNCKKNAALVILSGGFKNLSLAISNDASVTTRTKDTIDHFMLRLQDRGILSADDMVVKEKDVQISGDASIHLLKRSIGTFGLK